MHVADEQLSQSAAQPQNSRASDAAHGWFIIICSLLAVAAMSQHPHPTRHGPAGFAQEFSHKASWNMFVHGVLIATGVLLAVGLVRLGERLGLRERLLTRVALAAYFVGTAALFIAGSINGLLVSQIALRFETAPPEDLVMVEPLRILCKKANFVADVIGIVSVCIAIGLFSIGAVRRAPRWFVLTGVLACAAPLAMLSAGLMPMTVGGFATFVVMHAMWCIAVGAVLLRGSLRP